MRANLRAKLLQQELLRKGGKAGVGGGALGPDTATRACHACACTRVIVHKLNGRGWAPRQAQAPAVGGLPRCDGKETENGDCVATVMWNRHPGVLGKETGCGAGTAGSSKSEVTCKPLEW